MSLSRRASRAWPAGQALLAGSLAVALQGGCERDSTPDSMDDFVLKSGWLTTPADGHRADYDGDGVSDFTIYRPSTGGWAVLRTLSWQSSSWTWGLATDWPIRGDFDHDNKDDIGVWRPSTGEWLVLESSTGNQSYLYQVGGARGDVPVPGDYNGDGKTDFAYWTRKTGTWNVALNGGGTLPPVQWGAPGDEPVQADYDGDGKTDYAVWRPQSATWFYMKSSVPNGWDQKQWGTTMDVPMPGADPDGDHKADLMVYSPQTTAFLWLASSENYNAATSHSFDFPGGGLDTDPIFATDIPVTGNYSLNGLGSIGFWRPSTGQWTVQDSVNYAFQFGQQWGAAGDIPINGQRFVPFVSTARTRFQTVAAYADYESQVVTVPPNVAGCGPNGAAFMTGVENFKKMPLSCWQNGPSNPQNSLCTTQCLTNADCPSGQTCTPATGSAKTSTCTIDMRTKHTAADGGVDFLAATTLNGQSGRFTYDNNLIRMSNGHLLFEHIVDRNEPTVGANDPNNGCTMPSQPNHGQGLVSFFDSGDCGTTWTELTTGAITKAMFNNDWRYVEFDGSRALHNNPYSINPNGSHGRVYFSVENRNCVDGSDRSELFYSTNYAQTWTKYPPGLPFSGGSYSSTSSPRHREYFFGCPNSKPTLYVFSESTNQITAQWPDPDNLCEVVAWIDGSPNVSFVSSESDGDYVRIAYPQVDSGKQALHLANLHITGPDDGITVTKESENIIHAVKPGGSIVQVSQIEPDMLEVPASVPTNVTLLYWVESDGPVVAVDSTPNACREPNASGGLMCAVPDDPSTPNVDEGTHVTNKGMILRDLNIWSPVFPVSETDASGNAKYWSGWHCKGDYRRGGFTYDAASNMLNFFAYYIGDDDATWHTNMISAHP